MNYLIFYVIGLMQKHKRMDHIEVYTGSKRSQSKKMVQFKEKCGLSLQDILVTGETTAKKDSVFNSIRMEISTKVCGQWIRNMVKVPTGEMKIASLEENIPEIGSKIRSMVEELSSSKTLIGTMDIGSMVCHKEKVE